MAKLSYFGKFYPWNYNNQTSGKIFENMLSPETNQVMKVYIEYILKISYYLLLNFIKILLFTIMTPLFIYWNDEKFNFTN